MFVLSSLLFSCQHYPLNQPHFLLLSLLKLFSCSPSIFSLSHHINIRVYMTCHSVPCVLTGARTLLMLLITWQQDQQTALCNSSTVRSQWLTSSRWGRVQWPSSWGHVLSYPVSQSDKEGKEWRGGGGNGSQLKTFCGVLPLINTILKIPTPLLLILRFILIFICLFLFLQCGPFRSAFGAIE